MLGYVKVIFMGNVNVLYCGAVIVCLHGACCRSSDALTFELVSRTIISMRVGARDKI